MSGLKKGTITVECGPGMRNSLSKKLPFTEGLYLHNDDDEDIVQIQYELDNQDIEALISFFSKQEKKDYRLTCHSQDDQHNQNDYDLARDISKILAAEGDDDDIIPARNDDDGQLMMGNMGKQMDDSKKNLGTSNSKGLKSKSSSFYPPNDPRSNMQDDSAPRGGPIGSNIGQKQVPNMGVGGNMYYPTNAQPYKVNVDDFDQIFQADEDDSAYPQRMMPGMQNAGMMPNPNFNRGPAGNMGMGGMQQGLKNAGGMNMAGGLSGPGGNSMYPAQGGPNAPRGFKQGQMAGQGAMPMNPNYAQSKGSANSGQQRMQGQDPNFYGQGYEEGPMPKNAKGQRSGAKGASQRGAGYNDYGAYQEDDQMGYNNMSYDRSQQGMAGNYQGQGRMANPQQGYNQYQNDEFGDMSGNYSQGMGGGRNMANPAAPAMRGMGRGGQAGAGNRFPMDNGEYYEDEYFEDPQIGGQMSGSVGQQRGRNMGYDQGYEEYDDMGAAGYGGRQGAGYSYEYQNQYGNAPMPAQAVGMGQPAMGMGALVQEPFTVEGSINSQTFDRKPGFDRSRKKVHTRERLRSNMPKNKPETKGKKKNDTKNSGAGDETEKANEKQVNHDSSKEPKRENIDSDMEEGVNSHMLLEEEISSESNKQNSQGSLENNEENLSNDGNKDK